MIEASGKLTLNDDSIDIHINTMGRSELIEEARKLLEKFRGVCHLKISRPYSPRSTGEHSQEAHIRGHEADIAFQAKSSKWTTDEVHLLMKALCVKAGKDYPYKKWRGLIIYGSDSEINSLQANNLIETIHQFADENHFWLHEYTEELVPRVYKSIGGRTLEQMQKDYPELNAGMPLICESSGQESTQPVEPEKTTPKPEKIDPDLITEEQGKAEAEKFFDGFF
jgi:hypothetical protein